MTFLIYALLIGCGATVVMDIWALFIKRVWGVPSLDYALVGRWLGHMPSGRFFHAPIAQSASVPGEKALGWGVHYLIGVIFAAMLLSIVGLDWARDPSLMPAVLFGLMTVVAPFFLMQPGMGAGVMGSKTPAPNNTRMRSLMAHTSFGIGLYIAAWLCAQFVSI